VLKVHRVPKVHGCSKRVNAAAAKSARARSAPAQKRLKKRLRFPITSQNVGSPGGVPEVTGMDASRRQFKEE
jgi:hypothetical protein